MIALDTNILVYARREESLHHEAAARILARLAEGEQPWALPWPCIYEFLRVVTHPRVFSPPTILDTALEDVASLIESPSVMLLGEGPIHSGHLFQSIRDGHATGNKIHDAHIAALVVEHGVSEFWTADAGFARFPGLRCRNPFGEPMLAEAQASYRGGRARGRSRRRPGKALTSRPPRSS